MPNRYEKLTILEQPVPADPKFVWVHGVPMDPQVAKTLVEKGALSVDAVKKTSHTSCLGADNF